MINISYLFQKKLIIIVIIMYILLLLYLCIREMQFNVRISSVNFCNPRGDLLVGLNDQAVVVRIQDYLPVHILSEILSNPAVWEDDAIETSKSFDSSLDFWELYRAGLEKRGVDLKNWHINEV